VIGGGWKSWEQNREKSFFYVICSFYELHQGNEKKRMEKIWERELKRTEKKRIA